MQKLYPNAPPPAEPPADVWSVWDEQRATAARARLAQGDHRAAWLIIGDIGNATLRQQLQDELHAAEAVPPAAPTTPTPTTPPAQRRDTRTTVDLDPHTF